MRLIDADKLLYNDIKCVDGNTYMVVHASEIGNALTAYDVDRVMEQLEKLSDSADDKIMEDDSEQYWDGFGDGVDKAISIVKLGF